MGVDEVVDARQSLPFSSGNDPATLSDAIQRVAGLRYNVLSYGALGNGTGDDGPAFEAALAAADGPPLSYLANVGAATDVGVTAEDVQNILVAIAPIVGTARVVSAAGNITRALGFAIAVAEAELERELEAGG